MKATVRERERERESPFRTGMGGTDVVDMKQEKRRRRGKVCAILCCDGVHSLFGGAFTLRVTSVP